MSESEQRVLDVIKKFRDGKLTRSQTAAVRKALKKIVSDENIMSLKETMVSPL